MEPMAVPETPAQSKKLKENRYVFNTPQPMQLCTPIITKPNINYFQSNNMNSQYPDLEMEVTPCVKTCKESSKKRALKLNLVNPNIFLENTRIDENAKEIDFLVLEAEEIFDKTNLDVSRDPTSVETSWRCNPQVHWVFIDHILKGFEDPQLRN